MLEKICGGSRVRNYVSKSMTLQGCRSD